MSWECEFVVGDAQFVKILWKFAKPTPSKKNSQNPGRIPDCVLAT